MPQSNCGAMAQFKEEAQWVQYQRLTFPLKSLRTLSTFWSWDMFFSSYIKAHEGGTVLQPRIAMD